MTRLNKKHAHARNSQSGFSALELLVATVIVLLLAAVSVAMISRIKICANIAQAKTEIIQTSMAIEMEKYDTGSYTLKLADLGSQTAPSGINSRLWKGPYLKNYFPLDPWKNNYFSALNFSIPSGAVSASYTIQFTDASAKDSMLIEAKNSKQITNATIKLNGAVVKTLNTSTLPVEFTITTVTLPANNTLQISLNGNAGAGVIFTIPGLITDARQPYLIISRGPDQLPGGKKLNADIIWYSDYSAFQD